MSVHLFGVRHHGPGSARALELALEALAPDVVLVEGPPDADEVVHWLAHADMQPPVALLVHDPETHQAAYYPFTDFSPEHLAIRYALAHDVPVRFMDLPVANRLALDAEAPEAPDVADSYEPEAWALLAQAAGMPDFEPWWERFVEHRRDPTDLFAAILEAIREVRAASSASRVGPRAPLEPRDLTEARREAAMRREIRRAARDHERVAVVCGAWHAPALEDLSGASGDNALLKKLPKRKVQATWIPWTSERLSLRSGYGAGLTAPGWYRHLWETRGDEVAARWVTLTARMLRAEGIDVPPSATIDAVRLADALASVRDLAVPGLDELRDALQAVLAGGQEGPMALVRDRLEVGDALGAVPEQVPAVPLQQDIAREQRRLRLKPTAEIRVVELDLRKPRDRQKSLLLHRLRVVGVDWGTPREVSGKLGTFHEHWELRWRVDFALAVIEASTWGTTLVDAASALLSREAADADELPRVAALLDRAVVAELPDAAARVLEAVQDRAARAGDVRHLMRALPPLARVARYGDVRQTPSERLGPVIDGLFERVVAGLAPSTASLDDDAAAAMVDAVEHVQEAVALLDRSDLASEWTAALRELARRDEVHGLLRGWSWRLLLDRGCVSPGALEVAARRAVSAAVPAPQAAAWIEGLLRGSGLVLLHEDGLWAALDAWLSELGDDAFVELLPLLRRAFSGFEPAERRAMGDRLRRVGEPAPRAALPKALEPRAASVLPVLATILGVSDV